MLNETFPLLLSCQIVLNTQPCIGRLQLLNIVFEDSQSQVCKSIALPFLHFLMSTCLVQDQEYWFAEQPRKVPFMEGECVSIKHKRQDRV